MAYDDGYYYGQCKFICEAETVADNGKTVALTDGKNTWSKALSNKVAEFIVPGRARYTVSLLDGNVTKYTTKVDAGYGECLHVMLAAGYDKVDRSEFEARMKAVETKATTNATNITNVKKTADANYSDINTAKTGLKARMTAVETKAADNEKEISSVKLTAGYAKDVAEATRSTAEANTRSITSLGSRVTAVETKATSNYNAINTATTGLKARMTAVETTANNAKTKADTNASNITKNASGIAENKDAIKELKAAFSSQIGTGDLKAADGSWFDFAYNNGRYGFNDKSGSFHPFKGAGALYSVKKVLNTFENGSEKGSFEFTVTNDHLKTYDALIWIYAPATSGSYTDNISGWEVNGLDGLNGSSNFIFTKATRVRYGYTTNRFGYNAITAGQKVTVNSQYAGTGIVVLGIICNEP